MAYINHQYMKTAEKKKKTVTRFLFLLQRKIGFNAEVEGWSGYL